MNADTIWAGIHTFCITVFTPSFTYLRNNFPLIYVSGPTPVDVPSSQCNMTFVGPQSSYSGNQLIPVLLSVQMRYSTVCHTDAAMILNGTDWCALQIHQQTFCWNEVECEMENKTVFSVKVEGSNYTSNVSMNLQDDTGIWIEVAMMISFKRNILQLHGNGIT